MLCGVFTHSIHLQHKKPRLRLLHQLSVAPGAAETAQQSAAHAAATNNVGVLQAHPVAPATEMAPGRDVFVPTAETASELLCGSGSNQRQFPWLHEETMSATITAFRDCCSN